MPIPSKLQSIFRDVFDDDGLVLAEGASQETMADWDSFHQVKLVIAIEEEFGVKLTTEEAISLTSVALIEQCLRTKGVED